MHKKRPKKVQDETEQPLSREDARRRHKKRARRLMWKRIIIVAVIAVTALLVWRNWDVLAPDKLLVKLQDLIGNATGTYPVDISGTDVRTIAHGGDYTVVLSDSYLTYYNEKGGEVTRYSCTYAEAQLRTAGKYVLVAEVGGKRVQLSTRSSVVQDLTMERKILAVDVTSDGRFAVLTEGAQGYAVELLVYDQKGTQLYRRSRAAVATDVTLSPDGKTVALLSVDATNGVLSTSVEAFSLASSDPKPMYSHVAADTLLYRVEFLTNDRLAAVGENGALLCPLGGQAVSFAIGNQQLLGYAASADGVALVLRPLGETDGGSVVVVDGEGRQSCRVPFTGEFRHLTENEGQYLLLTDSVAQLITAEGASSAVEVAADSQQAVLFRDSVVVLGLSSLQKFELS